MKIFYKVGDMKEQDAKKIGSNHETEDYLSIENELLHDKFDNQYLINSDYYQEQLDLRATSEDKKINLILARELLNSNLKQLTKRQSDIIYYKMLRWTDTKISEKLKIERSTVSKHYQAAKKKLKKLFEGRKQIFKEINK